jgi:hypothetical protein
MVTSNSGQFKQPERDSERLWQQLCTNHAGKRLQTPAAPRACARQNGKTQHSVATNRLNSGPGRMFPKSNRPIHPPPVLAQQATHHSQKIRAEPHFFQEQYREVDTCGSIFGEAATYRGGLSKCFPPNFSAHLPVPPPPGSSDIPPCCRFSVIPLRVTVTGFAMEQVAAIFCVPEH